MRRTFLCILYELFAICDLSTLTLNVIALLSTIWAGGASCG